MISIGVTGHRYLVEVEKISAAIDQSIARIEAIGNPTVQLISTISEGAERLVIQRVLARSRSELVAVLPLKKEEYLQDFESEASRTEFLNLLDKAKQIVNLPPTATREQAYAAAGIYVLDHSDLLIAIWDGQDAQGPGGTGEVAQEARRRGMPLAWILAGNRIPKTTRATSLGQRQGEVRFENWPP